MPYTQVTQEQLRVLLQYKWEDVPFWTPTEANLALNETLQWYNLYTGVWQQRVVLTTTADTVVYTAPSTILASARVEYNGVPLGMSSLVDLDNGRPEWQSETTDGASNPNRPQLWAPVGMNQLAIWPADADGNNSLLIDGVMATPTLTADADFIDIDQSEIESILGEALYIATFKDPARWPRTQGWHQEFLRTVLGHSKRLNASNLFRQAAGLDGQRTMVPPTR